eukprot:11376596-Ditylum_brightwellii.AAC.1
MAGEDGGKSWVKQEPSAGKSGSEKKAHRRPVTRHSTFVGKTEELSGSIYNVGVPSASNLFVWTTQELAEHASGSVAGHSGLNKLILKEAGIDVAGTLADERAQAAADAKEAYLAMAFLASTNRAKYDRLLEELANNYLKGTDEYPRTMVATHKLLLNYQNNLRNHAHVTAANDGVAFVTDANGHDDDDNESDEDEVVTLANEGKVLDRNRKEVECFICGGNHYALKCPNKKKGEKDVVAFTWANIKWDDDGPKGGLMFHQHANLMCEPMADDAVISQDEAPTDKKCMDDIDAAL